MDQNRLSSDERKVILASSLGTVFEWYDFYLYGALASVISKQFFSNANPLTALVFALLAFAAGFLVRPLGAVVFGALGDIFGRKYTFLVSIVLMGLSVSCVGVLPTYETIGVAAPFILVTLRLLQGLAIGGEYGGAAVYVAEHAPAGRRGGLTAWIQTTATVGFLLSLVIVLVTRAAVGEEAFSKWGWRLPFIASLGLLGISLWIRLAMSESPVFAKMKAEGKTSKAPLRESFGQWENLRRVLIALFGVTIGLTVVWYTGQFYVLLFLSQTLKVDAQTSNVLVALALTVGSPFFVVFGTLSDKIGRKWIILGGMALAVVTYFPIFKALTHFANPALEHALETAPVVVTADPGECHFQFNPTGTQTFESSCDLIKAQLADASANYKSEPAPPGTFAKVTVGSTVVTSFAAAGLTPEEKKSQIEKLHQELGAALRGAGYPSTADPAQINRPMVFLLVLILMIYSTMVYGPSAALMVEMFPARIRYSSLSVPYHIGTGWAGGLLPTACFSLVVYRGEIYFGLWYPIIIASLCFAIGAIFLRETKGAPIH